MSKSYRLNCQNPKCGGEFLRYWPKEEFELLQYGGAVKGIGCFNCGYPKMKVTLSSMSANDGFVPGFQRSIGKHCDTYAEYKAHLKRMGLVEVGYNDIKEKEVKKEYLTDEFIKTINEKHSLCLTESEVKEARGA